jgi:hypothetical protein
VAQALVSLIASGVLAGCGAEAGTDEATENVAKVQDELTVTDQSFEDGAGDVFVQIRTCVPDSATSGSRCHYCALDQDWVLIGGGVEIEGSPTAGRLRASMPFPNFIPQSGAVRSTDGLENCSGNVPNNSTGKPFIAWMGRSEGASSYKMRTYAIGLKVLGMTADQLQDNVVHIDSTTTAMTQPSQQQASEQLLVGGGADEVGSRNCYLTESRPDAFANAWRATAYCSAAPGGLKTYGIFLNGCLPVPGWSFCMQAKSRGFTSGSSGSGYRTETLVTPYPWVTGSIGGKGVVNLGSSRFLADLKPLVGSDDGATITTKDAGTPVSGTTTAYVVNLLGGQWGFHRFNGFKFSNPLGGRSLYRPAGAAPATLQQALAVDAPPSRWTLENLGKGQYLLRNSNPNVPAQGECAFRQTGTTNVQVGPCSIDLSEHRWTLIGDPKVGSFQLRNSSSGTCLDNNNSSSDNAALRLATCVSGFSTRQSLTLTAVNWPK